MTNSTLSAKEVASQLGINPKRFRAFVRTLARSDAAIISACGQGNRYGISKQDAAKLVNAYRKAHPSHVMPAAHAPRKASKPRKPVAIVEPVVAADDRTQDDASHASDDGDA